VIFASFKASLRRRVNILTRKISHVVIMFRECVHTLQCRCLAPQAPYPITTWLTGCGDEGCSAVAARSRAAEIQYAITISEDTAVAASSKIPAVRPIGRLIRLKSLQVAIKIA